MGSGKTARIPIQVEEPLKEAFSERLSRYGESPTISEVLRNLMGFVVFATDEQLKELMDQGSASHAMVMVLDSTFKKAREYGLLPEDYKVGEKTNMAVFAAIHQNGGVPRAAKSEEVKQELNRIMENR